MIGTKDQTRCKQVQKLTYNGVSFQHRVSSYGIVEPLVFGVLEFKGLSNNLKVGFMSHSFRYKLVQSITELCGSIQVQNGSGSGNGQKKRI